ncbi:hypothetical protein HID58_056101 [Brassica napus]|uniref:Tyrosine--tRNA ligase n=1 Tax=Brassica napus TaxID=3708 RepID=A0ABQ8AM92_BRANA|nr:hypothetical protein HID58_056101 [Brassica napus]
MAAPSDNAPPTQASSLASKLQISEEVERRYNMIKSVGEQCINDDELRDLLAKKAAPVCYDGFEPSGKMHIAQGLMKIMNVNKLTSAGCRVKIWIADWFAFMNNKFGGDLKKIRIVGEYYKEIFQAAGMNGENVEFLWSSDEINARGDEYWPLVMDIACRNSLAKIKRCMPIMGHSETDELSAAHVLYVCMQCADPLFLEADICQLGMDQQTVNLLARDYCDETERGNKPVILSHHMLPGLLQGQTKMSTSDPSSAIFMEDDEAEVNRKIRKKAFCLPKIVEGNPCLEYVKYIILPWFSEFTVERDEKFGGNKTFSNFEDIAADYERDQLHPTDLKKALSKALNKILQPIRDHFKTNNRAKNLLKEVNNLLKQDHKSNRVVPTALSKEMKALSVNAPSSASGLQMSEEVEKKYNIVRSIGEECIQEDELKNLLAKKPTPICYDGFEPSGRMHIAQGVMKVTNVNKLTSAGCKVKIWIADWFAQLNNKLGGDLEKIKVVGEYFKEIWEAGGMNPEKVEFLWASDEISTRGNTYWPLVMDIARRNNLRRILRCGQIMGRSETEVLSAAQILYPCMQCADIFLLEADICQLGMDQRKVNMLAREYCDDIKRKNKPIILSHHMLPGLRQGQEKMSKSDPSSAIFMEDEEDAVNKKISEAHCPERTVAGNPCLEYVKYLVLPRFNEFVVENEKNGGNKTFTSFEDIAADYESGELSREDLKKALIKALNIMLQPVRHHFKTNERAKNLLKQVKVWKGMANKESSELGSLPTSPMAKRARTCETTGERLRGPVRVPRSIGLTNRGLAYGFDLYYNDDPPTLLVPCTWSKNYGIGLYGRIGLQCYNLQKGTNLKFKRLEKHSTKDTSFFSLYITLEATDPATGSVCSFQTQFGDAGRRISLGARITWLTLASTIKQIYNQPIDDVWDEDTPGINEFYKVPMPKWFSDEARERDSKKYYVVPESELHDNDWLQLLMEVAFFSKADRCLDAYLPLELKNVVVETFEDYTTEPSEKLKADNAIFYISYKCCSDPSTPLAGDHRAILDRRHRSISRFTQYFINARGDEYWPLVMDIACRNSLAKIKRCMPIMGHSETDELSAAHVLYVCMQCADPLFLEADICQLGMDQQTVNLLARDYCDETERGNKPVILSHHMLPTKMSKNDPSSAIFMDDDEGEVNRKIKKKAYCPPKIVEGNPCLEYVKYISLPWFNEFTVERDEKHGGNKTFDNFEDIAADYESDKLHPMDLKNALSKALNNILQPVHDHFKTNNRAKNLLKQDQKTNRVVATELYKEMEALSVNAPSSAAGLQRMHIAQGVMKVTNVNKLTSSGCQVKIWIADWFAQLNNKLGGDLEKIKVIGEYFKEIWQAGGMNPEKVEFLWASEEISSRGNKYWPLVMDIARRNNVWAEQIMGRSETEVLSAAQILYPCMQCADIFFLGADICQLGMDQRKVNMLAREYCDDIKRKNKPIILSHHMLHGLLEGQEKMSKSNPSSAIFMEDEEDAVNEKISQAHCPLKTVVGNPCLEYIKYLVLLRFNEFVVEQNGGPSQALKILLLSTRVAS